MAASKKYYVRYRERIYIPDYTTRDNVIEFKCVSFFTSGNLIYFKLDAYNLKSVAFEDIISITNTFIKI